MPTPQEFHAARDAALVCARASADLTIQAMIVDTSLRCHLEKNREGAIDKLPLYANVYQEILRVLRELRDRWDRTLTKEVLQAIEEAMMIGGDPLKVIIDGMEYTTLHFACGAKIFRMSHAGNVGPEITNALDRLLKIGENMRSDHLGDVVAWQAGIRRECAAAVTQWRSVNGRGEIQWRKDHGRRRAGTKQRLAWLSYVQAIEDKPELENQGYQALFDYLRSVGVEIDGQPYQPPRKLGTWKQSFLRGKKEAILATNATDARHAQMS